MLNAKNARNANRLTVPIITEITLEYIENICHKYNFVTIRKKTIKNVLLKKQKKISFRHLLIFCPSLEILIIEQSGAFTQGTLMETRKIKVLKKKKRSTKAATALT